MGRGGGIAMRDQTAAVEENIKGWGEDLELDFDTIYKYRMWVVNNYLKNIKPHVGGGWKVMLTSAFYLGLETIPRAKQDLFLLRFMK